ncbi:MAG: hypothetical protein SF339_22390 [Blastocatellia bacterium]|nr:hypothetical protein [Blastocatellia bacterium]
MYMNFYCVSNHVSRLLKLSPTFRYLAAKLDEKYVAFNGPSICALSKSGKQFWDHWAQDAYGVLRGGPFPGRRVLEVTRGVNGSRFVPAGSLDTPGSRDVIEIKGPSIADVDYKDSPRTLAEHIAQIAHETTHAFNWLTHTGPRPAGIPNRVRAAIAEEAATRSTEAKILSEITATSDWLRISSDWLRIFGDWKKKGRPNPIDLAGITGSTDTWQIQRDFFPSELKQTYLEYFAVSELALAAIQREKLTADDVSRINAEVKALKLHVSSVRALKTDYARVLWKSRNIDARWRALEQHLNRKPRDTDPDKEKLLQHNAHWSFRQLGVKYDPIPRKP